MVRFKRYCRLTAVSLAAAAVLFTGCSSSDTSSDGAAATEEDSAASEGDAEASDTASADETASDAVDIAEDFQKDAIRISLIDPQKPDDLGSVNSLVYKGLTFDAPLAEEITDEDVDEYLSTYILPYLPVEIENGAVEEGDTVSIDYEGLIDGEAFDGGSGSYDLVIGSGSFIDGFEEGLIGAKSGESVSLELTFPEDYWNEDLAGQEVIFNVDVNSISRIIELDEYNDAAARTLMEDDTATVESSREYIYDYLDKLAVVSAKSTLYNNAIIAATAASDIEPSDDAREWELDLTIKSYDKNLQAQGFSLAYYLYYGVGIGYDDFRDELKLSIDEPTRQSILKYAVLDAEGLEYNDDTRNEYLEEFDYTSEDIDSVADESEQEQAVIWYITAKTIVDNGTVNYMTAGEYAEKTGEE